MPSSRAMPRRSWPRPTRRRRRHDELPRFPTAAAHQAGKVAPLSDVNELHVEGVKIWYEEARTQNGADQSGRVQELDQPPRRALEIVGEKRWTAEVDHDASSVEDLHIGTRDEPVTRLVYLPGYVSWEHALGH